MQYQKSIFWSALACFLLSLCFLVSGSSLLLLTVGGSAQIPLGNITTALGVIALAILVWSVLVWQGQPTIGWHRMLAWLSKLGVLLSAIWLPLGRLLSGNWSNSFVNRPTASWWFWNTTYGIVGFPLLLLLVFGLLKLSRRNR